MTTSWRLLQWMDSAFPTGAYAHSAGMEAWGHGAPQGAAPEDALRGLVTSQGSLSVPFVRAAHAAPHLDAVRALDAEYDACLWGESAHRASRTQGGSLLQATRRSYPDEPVFDALAAGAPLHHAVAFGALARHVTGDADDVGLLFLYGYARAAVSAAVRLNLFGPFEGQAVLAGLEPIARAAASAAPSTAMAASTSPYLDLVAEQHVRLHTRLFSS